MSRPLPSLLNAVLLPLRVSPLLLAVLFSFLFLLASHAGLLGLPIALVVGSWFFKYGFVLLDHAADGQPGAPVLAVEDVNPFGEARPLLYAVAIAGYYLATVAIEDDLGPYWAFAARLAGLLALPAVLATHVVTGSFATAINPLAIVRMAWGLGPGYLLVLVVAIDCAMIGRATLLGSGWLGPWPRMLLLELLWLAMFSTVGGVIHARRLELGFEPAHSPERRERRASEDLAREHDHFIDQIFAEYRSGHTGNAWATIEQRIAQSADPAAEYAWIHERASTWPNPRLANRIAQALLPLLLARQRNGEALEVARTRLRTDPAFRPKEGAEAIRLAELARAAGDRTSARSLLEDFEHRYPDHSARNVARRLSEDLDRR
ncbi:MAG TPA: hypothetical protein VMT50_09935 [Steroidobacteraceae bacterium]|nr:hypothetical protein [Steroidobacteraceae bacterium]